MSAGTADLPDHPGRPGPLRGRVRRLQPDPLERPRRHRCRAARRDRARHAAPWRWRAGRSPRGSAATRARSSTTRCGSPARSSCRTTTTGTELTVTGVVEPVEDAGLAQLDLTAVCARREGARPGARDRSARRATSPRPCRRSDRRDGECSWELGNHRRYPYTGRPWVKSTPGLACPPHIGGRFSGRGRFLPHRGVAQLAEQRSPKPQVAGSSPVTPASAAPIEISS